MSALSLSFPRVAGRVRAAVGATLAIVLPSVAASQPACAAATVTTYLAEAFSCQIAGWEFTSFSYNFGAFPDLDVQATAARDDEVMLRPFATVDARGHRRFGFAFDGFGTSVTANGASRGGESALAIASFSFLAYGLTPGASLLAAGVDLSATLDATSPAASVLASSVSGDVGNLFIGSSACLQARAEAFAQSGRTDISAESPCDAGTPPMVLAVLMSQSFVNRGQPGTEPLVGTTTGEIGRVTLVDAQVVPEPATVTLLAGGLLALAAGVRRLASTRA